MQKKVNKNIFGLLSLLLMMSTFSYGEDISINATVNSTNITLNDILSYSVNVQGTTKISHIPQPEGSNFIIVNGPFESSNIQIINGKMETKKSYTWQLQPQKEGELIVNGFSVQLKRKKYSAERVIVKVSKARYQSGKSKSNSGQKVENGSKIFLDAVPSKSEVYLGEQVVIEYKLIYNMRITNYGTEKLPQAKGFWMEEFPEIRNPQSNKIVIDGVDYYSATIKRIALFPTATGKLEIDPMITQCEVVLPKKRKTKSRSSSFDSFFDDSFFGSSVFDRTTVKRVISQPLTINVKPLPDYADSDTLPCVMERLSIYGEVDTVKILRDKALTLKYRVSGFGNINAVNLESPKLPGHVEVFPPKVNKKTINSGPLIKGTAAYEYVVIPHKAGELKIPPIKLTYFDTKLKKYQTIQSKAFNISVLEDKNKVTINSGLNKEEILMLDQDIRYILKSEVKWKKKDAKFYKNSSFVVINILSLIFILSAIGVNIYGQTVGSNPILLRKNRAMKNAQEKIQNSQNLLKENQLIEALSGFDNAISGFVADRLNLPEAGLGPVDFKNELIKLHVNDNLVKDVFSFLENMELYKYSSGAISSDEVRNLPEKCNNLLSKLSKVI